MTRSIGTAPIDFCGILTRECAAAVRGASAVRINNDLSSRQPGVAMRAANFETAGWIDQVAGPLVKQMLWNDMLDDMFNDIFANPFLCCIGIVLSRHDHRVDALHAATVVFDSHLRLSVGAKVRHELILFFSDVCQTLGEFLGVHDRHGHQFGSFAACVAEHHSLVSGAACVDTHRNIRRL